MASIHALPASGEVFLDARDGDRAMRLSWHGDGDLAVFSIWRAGTCVASFQLGRNEIPALVETLARGLAEDQSQQERHTHHAS